MQQPQNEVAPEPVANVEAKAIILLVLMAALIGLFLLYIAYARGVFQPTQRLVLVSDDSKGVVVGMDMTFSGFPIGRVQQVELGPDGKARILIDVPVDDAKWLRTSSIFTLERGMVGDTSIKAFSGILTDPPLPDNAVRPVLTGDTAAEIPRLVASARSLLENLVAMTDEGSSINATLSNIETATGDRRPHPRRGPPPMTMRSTARAFACSSMVAAGSPCCSTVCKRTPASAAR